MPNSLKGIPFPAISDAPNVPQWMQAMAEDLDFTKVPLLTAAGSGLSNASMLSAYATGVSVLSLSSAEGSAGGWPGGTSCHIWTFKPTGTRAWQWLFLNSTVSRSWARALQPDPGPHAPWVIVVDGTAPVWTQMLAGQGMGLPNGYSRLMPDGVTVRLKGNQVTAGGSLTRGITIATITAAHRPPAAMRVTLAIGNAVAGPATTGALIDTNGTIGLTSIDSLMTGHTNVYFDSISYTLT